MICLVFSYTLSRRKEADEKKKKLANGWLGFPQAFLIQGLLRDVMGFRFLLVVGCRVDQIRVTGPSWRRQTETFVATRLSKLVTPPTVAMAQLGIAQLKSCGISINESICPRVNPS